MSRKARTWAAAAASLALLAGGALAYGQVSGTFALFSAETKNPNAVFNGSWVPQILTPTSALNGSPYSSANLTWTLGTAPPGTNPITGYALEYADGGSGGSATCSTYGSFSNPAGSNVNVTGTNFTDWWCFRVHATTGTVWTSNTATFTAVRLFVPTAVTLSNTGGTSQQIEQGDTIFIDFNQPPTAPGGTFTVSTNNANGTITIGSIGTLTGFTIASSKSYTGSSATVSGNRLTVSVNGGGNGSSGKPTSVTGYPGTFTGSGTYTAGAGTKVCTAAACQVATTSTF